MPKTNARPASFYPAMHAQLHELYPAVFTDGTTPPVPLKVGIRQDLLDAHHGLFSQQLLSRFLATWSGRPEYRAVLIEHADRYDLGGEPCGIVTAEHVALGRAAATKLDSEKTNKAVSSAGRITGRAHNSAAPEVRSARTTAAAKPSMGRGRPQSDYDLDD